MMEKRISIEAPEVMELYGVNNDNVQFLSQLFPQLKLVARGTELRVMGDEEQLEAFSAFLSGCGNTCRNSGGCIRTTCSAFGRRTPGRAGRTVPSKGT